MSALPISGFNRRWMLAGTGAALALAACSSGAVPRDNYYRLGAAANLAPLPGGPIHGTADVSPFRADGLINERAILYRDAPNTLAQYSYQAWLEPPSVMLQRAFANALRAAQAFDLVSSPDMRLDRDYELMGTITQWEHVLGGAQTGATAAIALEIGLRRIAGNQEVLLKTYHANEAAGESVASAIDAFTQGLDKILAAFMGDLAGLPKALPSR